MLSGLVSSGSLCFSLEPNGPVAQRLEQGTHNPLVPGSNPGGPSLRFGAQQKSEGCHAVTKWRRACFTLLTRRSKGYGLAGHQMKNEKLFLRLYLSKRSNEDVHYTGIARALKQRLLEHNRGTCAHTSKYRPWRVETKIAFKSEIKARRFEKYLKAGSGREFARRHF